VREKFDLGPFNVQELPFDLPFDLQFDPPFALVPLRTVNRTLEELQAETGVRKLFILVCSSTVVAHHELPKLTLTQFMLCE
jgi:hypothetical protein